MGNLSLKKSFKIVNICVLVPRLSTIIEENKTRFQIEGCDLKTTKETRWIVLKRIIEIVWQYILSIWALQMFSSVPNFILYFWDYRLNSFFLSLFCLMFKNICPVYNKIYITEQRTDWLVGVYGSSIYIGLFDNKRFRNCFHLWPYPPADPTISTNQTTHGHSNRLVVFLISRQRYFPFLCQHTKYTTEVMEEKNKQTNRLKLSPNARRGSPRHFLCFLWANTSVYSGENSHKATSNTDISRWLTRPL